VSIFGGVIQVGNVLAKRYDWDFVEQNEVRSVDPDALPLMIEEIEKARKERDSVGGVVEVRAEGVPPGLGDPVFAKLDANIAGAMMSIPAVKGVEIGAGFRAPFMRGSEMNDEFFPDGFHTNNHGGILGGISSGAPICVRMAIKPTSSLPQEQQTIDTNFQAQTIVTKGRHDPCVALRAVPIAEAMLALVLVDAWMEQCAQRAVQATFAEMPEIKYQLKKDEA
jgi:chorismate synthase